ncbi:biotin carboxylase N-terminal domain-containing protein [Actinomyces polynesiensis]|uniref:ATP-binding protein n=1 Tax=Actinomyces polynesiensis TaxID=1325934 RepID=UPI0005BE0E10|nr:biotin carboxylase N-terminal domain-containing protein [Actinomyces polynesiensis]
MRTINRILVANRGEIALRVIRTAIDMEIGTVAVYADQDIAAPFAHEADEAWGLDGTTAEETYLNAEAILTVALGTGADAVHPGYGFLSEDPDFARAVEDAGIAWIGPSGAVIEALGDKIRARRVAESCGVAPVPGVSDPVRSRSAVEEFIAEHGYPVVLKRADGGGGRGISVLRDSGDLDRFFSRHTTRATGADTTGTPSDLPADLPVALPEGTAQDLGQYFVERFVQVARHVETQCARDSLGTFRVVSTRDCSVQRRNQKLIEEAPAPFLPEGVHDQLVDSSRRLFEAVGYVGVGTCEFLLEPDGSLWFLEVNPRLQVEHPVSEEVAGVDLVREQVRIAEGLPLSPPAPGRGHSLEFRITCEDPAQDLVPVPGRVERVRWPSGPGVRLELGLAEGDEVEGAFDSMIAKIIVTGSDREEALARSRRALGEFAIEGVATPVPLYRDILDDPAFIGADGFTVSTRWLEDQFLPGHDHSPGEGATPPPPPVPSVPRQTYVIELDGRRMTLTVPSGLLAPGVRTRPAQPLRSQRQERTAAGPLGGASSDGTITSPMQGIVVQVPVEVGAHVDEGDLVVVLEAMKMEKYVQAPHPGTVVEVLAPQGTSVTPGDALLRIEKEQA